MHRVHEDEKNNAAARSVGDNTYNPKTPIILSKFTTELQVPVISVAGASAVKSSQPNEVAEPGPL